MNGPGRSPDVLIVGAGPAGSTAAILLARAGARVTLVDKARFPRDKLCGEFVAPESLRVLDRIGVLPELAAIGGRASAVVLSDSRGRSVRLPVPGRSTDGPGSQSAQAGARTADGFHGTDEVSVRSGFSRSLRSSSLAAGPVALGVPRREMDALLVERAAKEGAEVVEGIEIHEAVFGARAGSLGSGAAAVGVIARDRATGRETTLRARFILAADGRDSALARALSPARSTSAPHRSPGRPSALFGLQAHYRNVGDLGETVELHYFQGGYVGLHAIGARRVNVCALIDRSLARPTQREPEKIAREVFFRNAAARARLEGAERISDWLAVGSLVFHADAPVRAGILFLGDAAGTIDPFAGEGMSMAFRSAEIAAEEIAFALGIGGATGDVTRAGERSSVDGSTSPSQSFVTRLNGGGVPAGDAYLDADDRARRVYATRWRREFALRIAICRTIGRLAARRAFQTPAIAALGFLPFAGRLLAGSTRVGVTVASRRA